MKHNAPCKDCQNRQVGCHSICSFYKDFKAECDEINEKRRVSNREYRYKVEQVLKTKRKKWKNIVDNV